jgi:leucyl/phenylalanyl-tRNA---protein transferase
VESFAIQELIDCYRRGVFPMADARDDPRVFLVDPNWRGIIPLERFHISRRLARTVRSDRFQVRIDQAFEAVVEGCASPRPGRLETWINGPIQRMCQELFRLGLAHSVEAWSDGRLAGGLYGVAIGGAFFGESMFSVERDASKVALTHLVARLVVGGFKLLDTQFITEHLTLFGTEEISRADYAQRLARALAHEADFLRMDPYAGGAAAMQAISQAS